MYFEINVGVSVWLSCLFFKKRKVILELKILNILILLGEVDMIVEEF